jgi:LasA protease
VYSRPDLGSEVVGVLYNGDQVTIECTAHGGVVTGATGAVSTLWDRVEDGFVPDVAVDTGSNEPVAPPCS